MLVRPGPEGEALVHGDVAHRQRELLVQLRVDNHRLAGNAERLQQARLGIIDGLCDFKVPFEDHVKTIFHGVFAAQHRARRIRAYFAESDQFLDLIRFDAREGARYDF